MVWSKCNLTRCFVHATGIETATSGLQSLPGGRRSPEVAHRHEAIGRVASRLRERPGKSCHQRLVKCSTNHPTSASEAFARSSAVRNP